MYSSSTAYPYILCTRLTILLILLTCQSSWANHGALRVNPFNTNPINSAGQATALFGAQLREALDHEVAQQGGEHFSAFVFSGGLHGTSSTLISAPFTTVAYLPERINQTATAITYTGASNTTCWTIISSDNDGITTWTRVGSGSTGAYYYQCESNNDTTPTQPLLPPNSAWLLQVTINTASAISVVSRPSGFCSNPQCLVFNALDNVFGAVGNGTTNDTIAVQAALTSGSAMNGTVIIPRDSNFLVDQLSITGRMILTGGGTLTQNVAGQTTLRIRASNVVIDHIRFVGSGNTGISENGILTDEAYDYGVIKNCIFTNMTIGVDVNTSGVGTKAKGWRVSNNTFHDIVGTALFGYGILAVDVREFIINNNTFHNVNRHAVYLSAGTSNSIVSNNTVNHDTIMSSAAMQLSAVAGQNQNYDNQFIMNTIRNTPFAFTVNENSHRTIIAFNKILRCNDVCVRISNDGGGGSTRHPLGTIVKFNDFASDGVTFVTLIRATDGDGTQIIGNTGTVTSSGGSGGAIIGFENADATYNTPIYGYVGYVADNRIISDVNVHGIRINYASAIYPVIISNNEFPNMSGLHTSTFTYLKRVSGTFNNQDTRFVRRGGGTETLETKDSHFGIEGTLSRTVTLPPAAAVGEGKVYVIKDEGGNAGVNNHTIAADGTETIDNAATILISTSYGSRRLYSIGSRWYTQ